MTQQLESRGTSAGDPLTIDVILKQHLNTVAALMLKNAGYSVVQIGSALLGAFEAGATRSTTTTSASATP